MPKTDKDGCSSLGTTRTNKMKIREKIFYDYLIKLFKISQGEKFPWYLYIIGICFFPLKYLKTKFNCYDMMRDIYIIEGISFSGAFFRNFNIPSENKWFRIIEVKFYNDKKLVTIETKEI
jgi:hypothetical protein